MRGRDISLLLDQVARSNQRFLVTFEKNSPATNILEVGPWWWSSGQQLSPSTPGSNPVDDIFSVRKDEN